MNHGNFDVFHIIYNPCPWSSEVYHDKPPAFSSGFISGKLPQPWTRVAYMRSTPHSHGLNNKYKEISVILQAIGII